MSDQRLLLAVMLGACVIGGIVIGLLLRGGPQGVGGSAVDLGALVQWAQGKKTYLGMVTLAVNNYAARRGWIDAQLASDLNLALGTLTGIAFIAKTNRIEQKTETAVTAAKIASARPTTTPFKEGL